MWHSAGLDHYICVYCGYVESYIGGVNYLQQIAAKYPRLEKPEQAHDEKDRNL
jgi:Zn ribbon nucleic-acid-binding protein